MLGITAFDVLALLRARGASPALVAAGRTVTSAELADRVAARAAEYGPDRSLVAIAMRNDLESVVSYLATLAGGHVALLAGPCQLERVSAGVGAGLLVDGPAIRHTGTTHELHPDLALLLSTSGSTGSPKLVRLSRQNLLSNARAIADYLAIRPSDRAITVLPLHYTYGLSVLHSHLLAGATVVLTDASVTDPEFTELMAGVTTLAGVPHTFDLLDRSGFADQVPTTLRTVTQAGGRMDPASVRRWAALGQRSGFDFFVMYGQTEATARMLYLPPDQALEHPAAVGVPIPGGAVRIDPMPEAGEGVGELIYQGRNVMMGYAETAADLARGPELAELRTGDLARRNDAGLIEIVGRRSRFAKVFGLRVDLAAVEQAAAAAGYQAWCLEGEGSLLVATLADPALVGPVVARAASLPVSAVDVHQVAELPRTAAGKPDYATLRSALQPKTSSAASAAGVYAAVLGKDPASIQPSDTFVGLGGDSMSYVACAAALEGVLGQLPADWHHTPVGELQPVADRPNRWRAMDTTVVLRAIAIILIAGSHIGVMDIRGGAHLLIAVAGWNFARFRLQTHLPQRAELRAALRSVGRVVVPAVVWLSLVVLIGSEYSAHVIFGINLFAPLEYTPEWRYWYIEALVFTLLAAIALLSIPALYRLHRRYPFPVALAVLAATLALHYPLTAESGPTRVGTPVAVAWLFAAGWALAQAPSVRARLVVIAVVAFGLIDFFNDPWRAAVVLAGIALFALRPSLPVPAFLVSAVTAIAGATLWIYLVHWQVYPPLKEWGWLALAASLVAGVLAHRTEVFVRHRIGRP